jgi:hypothetical protein
MRDRLIVMTVAGVLAVGSQALAHHGVAEYDVLNAIEIEGTVTEFIVANPHTMLFVEVIGEDGEAVEWALETTSPRGARAAGGIRNVLKAGDKVKVRLVPAKSGAPVGRASSNLNNGWIVKADGTLVVGRTPEEQAELIETIQEN